MKNLPAIQVISASDSESESSSSSQEEFSLEKGQTEIELIGSVHKTLQKNLTYQLMEYKNTSRQLLSEVPGPTPFSTNESNASPQLDSFESKPTLQTIQALAQLSNTFQASQAELLNAKKSVSKISSESDYLYEKLRNLEKQISDHNNKKLTEQSHCSCRVF